MFVAAPPPATLDNCAREPIHLPGLLQSHGALLAFDAQGVVTHATSNTRAWLGETSPALHERFLSSHLEGNPLIHAAVREANQLQNEDGLTWNQEVALNGRHFDLVTHRFHGTTIIEFESRGESLGNDVFAAKAYRAMNRMRHHESIDDLLEIAVVAVRELTGFDRVMAYRFHDDDTGEIAAEAKIDEWESFRGRRYPAGDIPPQARRLYLLNTLRLIADVDAPPLRVEASQPAAPALDMSHCVLRSVSPIHLEYLRNIGVRASMSISVVVNGHLWGMVACHHHAPRQVPYTTRIACDVLAQTLAAQVQSLVARRAALEIERASALRGRLIEAVLHAEDSGAALASMSDLIATAFSADVVIVAEDDKLHVHGALERTTAVALVRWLASSQALRHEVLTARSRDKLPADLASTPGTWCGYLAMRYDEVAMGWLVLLRKEQIETITWGDAPAKVYPSGPLGARLTPQGSLAAWRETVRGRCVQWSRAELELARQLVDELARASAARMAELNRARSQLLAMLGHDLRDPLHSISMATSVLEVRSFDRSPDATRIAERIRSSTDRMARLIGQVLDASRLQNGLGLPIQPELLDMSALLLDIVTESRLAYPDVTMLFDPTPPLHAMVDADRMMQLIGNLISNARHHGTPGEPVIVQLVRQENDVFVEVANMGRAIAADMMPILFSAFHRLAEPGSRNRSGLGLGLHIAQAVARGHGGGITYKYANDYVVFTLRFPVGKGALR